jgi:hypothetical protein
MIQPAGLPTTRLKSREDLSNRHSIDTRATGGPAAAPGGEADLLPERLVVLAGDQPGRSWRWPQCRSRHLNPPYGDALGAPSGDHLADFRLQPGPSGGK